MIKPVGGMLLVTKTEESDKTTKSGLVISEVFNDSGPKSGTIVDIGDGEVNYKGDLIPIPELDIGDVVYFPDHTCTEIKDDQSNMYLLINHKHITAKKKIMCSKCGMYKEHIEYWDNHLTMSNYKVWYANWI